MKKIYILLVLTCMIMVSCYESDICNTNHPNKGMIEASIKTPNILSAPLPDDYWVEINNNKVCVDAASVIKLPNRLYPGEYSFCIYNMIGDVNISKNIASANIENGMIMSIDGLQLYGYQTVLLEADKVTSTVVNLEKLTRKLVFELNIQSGDGAEIKAIKSSLSGVAYMWDCKKNVALDDPMSVDADINYMPNKLTGEVELLGINGDLQTLILDITYNNDATQLIELDMSAFLSDFNDEKDIDVVFTSDVALVGY